jgi:hypothetical protein
MLTSASKGGTALAVPAREPASTLLITISEYPKNQKTSSSKRKYFRNFSCLNMWISQFYINSVINYLSFSQNKPILQRILVIFSFFLKFYLTIYQYYYTDILGLCCFFITTFFKVFNLRFLFQNTSVRQDCKKFLFFPESILNGVLLLIRLR